MRVVIVTNAIDEPRRGNHTTVWRWLAHVRGVEVEAIPADPDQRLDPVPDIVHGYHLLNGGVAAAALARRYERPLVVSLGGTDLLALQGAGPAAKTAREVVEAAACVTGAFDSFRERLGAVRAYAVVPRGVVIPEAAAPKTPDGTLDVLVPSGLRPVKDPLAALDLARGLFERGLPVAVRVLGPSLDDAYARRVRDRAESLDFVRLGEVPFEEMGRAYAAADVVWNTALHEGGANVLLEAIAHGCAVFARDVPGNRDFFSRDGAPARLFDPRDPDAAAVFHRALLEESAETRRERAARGIAWLREHHDPGDEARALERVWRNAVG